MTRLPFARLKAGFHSTFPPALSPTLLSLILLGVTPSFAQGAAPVLPPFPPGLFFPVDQGKAPTIPGATLQPSAPIFDFAGVPGWVQGTKVTNSMKVSIPKYEMLVIRGSHLRHHTIVIPPGGLYYDSSPARGEIPMTGSSDFILGKRYYFVDYDARIHVRNNVAIRQGRSTIVGNHLYTLLLPPIPKVVLNPVVHWQTFDGVSIRPWAFTERWAHPSTSQPDQRAMTYLQGVIHTVDKKGVTFASLTGTAIHREWWAKNLLFEGVAKAGQQWVSHGQGVRIDRIDPGAKRVTVSYLQNGKKVFSKTLVAKEDPTLPENPDLRQKMITIHGTEAVVLWPHGAIENGSVRLWIFGGVEEWKTNHPLPGLTHYAYFPIACPIAHHIGGMLYNQRSLHLVPGQAVSILGGYAKIKVESIQGAKVKFLVETKTGKTPEFSKSGNIDGVIGEGRAAHGILASLDTTDLALSQDLAVKK